MRKILYCNQDGCKYKTNMLGNLNMHKSNIHNINVTWYRCNQEGCGYKSKSNITLKQHLSNLHNINVTWYNCDQENCYFKCKLKGNLKKHKTDKHNIDVKWNYCEQKGCEHKSKFKADLKRHEANIHNIGVKWNYCDQKCCEYKSKQLSALNMHKSNIHNINVTWYNCNQEGCDYKSKSNGDLKIHILYRHTKDEDVLKWFICSEVKCKEKFKVNTELKKHLENIHDIGNHKCEFCLGNRFSSIAYNDQNGKHKICRTCYNKVTGKNSRAETQMSKFLDEKYGTEHLLKTDRTIKGEVCSRYRPDKLYASPGFVLQIECDEQQHTSRGGNYSCDEKRISDIYDEFPGNKYVVIRWNPDKYKHETKLNRQQRLNLLLKTIKFVTENLSKIPQIFIIYMFYDSDNPRISKNIPNKFIYTENDLKI